PAGDAALAAHLEGAGLALADAMRALAARAAEAVAAKEEAFRPLRQRVGGWITAARAVEAQAELERHLKAAEAWLTDAELALRDEGFAPIAAQVERAWEALGQTSHVALERVALAGRATRRHVELAVTVDGHAGAGVAVMSQGELNALALSLFLPRMTLPQSPFRFLVIDDPVQAMDPMKVDGLARVLEEAARTRQVVVLTHDERLHQAVRRMRIEATVLSVARRAGSVVEVQETRGPVDGYLADARAMCGPGAEAVGGEVARRLVPGFCRSALEAACVEVVRRRRLGRGEPHDAVEEALAEAGTLMQYAALAFFDDVERGGNVFARANELGRWAGDTLRDVKEGAHGKVAAGVDLEDLIGRTARLAAKLEALA
ncbi:MAG: hypothetical protein KF729_15550, partial [Sandaracinaceae bacterium]|nr:hypothetical protein [Sandaracinaceae bacterium]